MRVGRSHKDVFSRHLTALPNKLFSFIKNRTRDHTTVGDDNSEAGLTVIQHDGPGMEGIVNICSLVVVHVAFDRKAHPRRDINGCGSGAKYFGRFGLDEMLVPEKQSTKQKQAQPR